MTRPQDIDAKLNSLHRYRGLLDRYRSRPIEVLLADPDLKGAMERYLFLATQAAIDLAEMVCKLKGLGRPENMSNAFELMHAAGLMPEPLLRSMTSMVGFRNSLVHGYDNLDDQVVDDVLRNHLGDLDRFAEIVAALG